MPSPTVTASARIEVQVTATAELLFSVAAARGPVVTDEHLTITLDGRPLAVEEVVADHGGRLHLLRDVPPGALALDYRVTAGAPAPQPITPEPTAADAIAYRRPSRYCESDLMLVTANRLFGGLTGQALVDGVVGWVADQTRYVPGSSGPSDGAVDTFLAGQGVCRDYAHLVTALLRAAGVPARLVSVYAPGLSPMDFHAVVEAAVDGRWQVVDATGLAPRASLVRIATGRDAADTAFLTVHAGATEFSSLRVSCVAHPGLPLDAPGPVHL